MEDDLQKMEKNGRQPQKKKKGRNEMEDDLQKKWKTNQSTKNNLIGCDTIVHLPSLNNY